MLGHPKQLLSKRLLGDGTEERRWVEKAIGVNLNITAQIQEDELCVSILPTMLLNEGSLEEKVSWKK